MLHDWVKSIVDEVSAWDGMTTAPHRFGGVEFKLGNVEIGHIHSNGMVDIPFTVKTRAALVGEGATGLHHLLHESGWTTFYVRSADDAAHALRLYRLSYLHKQARRPSERTSGAYVEAVAALGFGAGVRASVS
jgi:hypothetical protein